MKEGLFPCVRPIPRTQVRPQGVAGINDAAINGSLEQHKEDELLM